MRKLSLFAATFLLVGGAAATNCGTSPGLTPGDAFYSLDIAAEKVNLFLTVSEKDRSELRLDYASERLAEAEMMEKGGETAEARELLKTYSELVQDAEKADKYTKTVSRHASVLEDMKDSVELDMLDQKFKERFDLVEETEQTRATGFIGTGHVIVDE